MANSLKGLQQAVKELKSLQEQSRRAMRRGEKKVADIILAQAKANAPVVSSRLKNSGGIEQTETDTTIFFSAPHAAYTEFGTGPLTQVPPGQEEYASEFFIDGSGHTPPRPYFFRAIFTHQDKIVTAVEEELNKIK